MAQITLDLIKKLREQTQVGMMTCKKALIDANGDFDAAVESLRKKGASVAAKRAENATDNGTVQVVIAPDFRSGSITEVSCETDFSANTDLMKNFALSASSHLLATTREMEALVSSEGDITTLMSEELASESGLTFQDKLDDLISKITEKITISKFARMETSNGLVNGYVHPGANLGVLVELALDGDRPSDVTALAAAAKDVCMQVAVTNPLCIDPSQLDAAVVDKERAEQRAALIAQGKPEQMVDKIVEGKMGKFYEGVCLHNQKFIKEDKITISHMLDRVAQEAGCKVRVANFVRFSIGG